MKSDNPGLAVYEYQLPKKLNQAAPVQNTWYTIGLLDGVMKNARVYRVGVNVEDTGETVQVRGFIDGQETGTSSFALTHSTAYFAYMLPDPITRLDDMLLISDVGVGVGRAFLLEGHLIEIQVRKTTAAGVGNLTGVLAWGQLKNA